MKFRLAQNTKLEILKYILSMLMVMLIGTCIILSQSHRGISGADHGFRGKRQRHRDNHPLGNAQYHNRDCGRDCI